MGPRLRRIRPGRDETPAAVEGGVRAADAGDPLTEPGADPAALPAPDGDPAGAGEDSRALPAGVAPEELIGDPPDTRRRGRLRRRLRHLRQVRELVLRDVGGLLYEVHRVEQDPRAREHGMSLVQAKLERLTALDAERHALEATLSDRRGVTVVREPGVGGTCPACGEYFASDAHFCAYCGARVDGRTPAEPVPAQGPDAPQDPEAASAVASPGPHPDEAPTQVGG